MKHWMMWTAGLSFALGVAATGPAIAAEKRGVQISGIEASRRTGESDRGLGHHGGHQGEWRVSITAPPERGSTTGTLC